MGSAVSGVAAVRLTFAHLCAGAAGCARNKTEMSWDLRRDCGKAGARRYGVHFLCAWIDITTPNPVSSVIADVPP
jgi:hypothetical protein